LGRTKHWKTGKTAFDRNKNRFRGGKVAAEALFVGAAVADKMAREIWEDLNNGARKTRQI